MTIPIYLSDLKESLQSEIRHVLRMNGQNELADTLQEVVIGELYQPDKFTTDT